MQRVECATTSDLLWGNIRNSLLEEIEFYTGPTPTPKKRRGGGDVLISVTVAVWKRCCCQHATKSTTRCTVLEQQVEPTVPTKKATSLYLRQREEQTSTHESSVSMSWPEQRSISSGHSQGHSHSVCSMRLQFRQSRSYCSKHQQITRSSNRSVTHPLTQAV